MKRLRKAALPLILSATLLLSGCGAGKEKNKDTEYDGAAEEIIEEGGDTSAADTDTEENTSGQAAEELTGLRTSLGDVPDHLTAEYEFPSSQGKVTIDSDVIIPELGDTLPLKSFELKSPDTIDVKAFADQIFDANSYEVYPRAYNMDLEFQKVWEEKLDTILHDSSLSDAEKACFEDELAYIRSYITNKTISTGDVWQPENAGIVSSDQGFSMYPVYSNEIGDDAAKYQQIRLLGKIDGAYYFLELEKFSELLNLMLYPANLLYHDFDFFYTQDFYPDSLGYSLNYDTVESDVLSQSKAEEAAWELLDKVGIQDVIISDILPTEYREVISDTDANGNYNMHDGETHYGWNVHFSYHLDQLTLPVAERNISVYSIVTGDGYTDLRANIMLETAETDQKVTTLLPFDSVLSSAQHYFNEICTTMKSEQDADMDIQITEIRLGCYPYEDADGNHLILPAWFFCSRYENYYGAQGPVLVLNAIDGTMLAEYYTGGVG